jgi:hypothetical protein
MRPRGLAVASLLLSLLPAPAAAAGQRVFQNGELHALPAPPMGLTFADLDGDARPDAALAHAGEGQVSVLFLAAGGWPAPAVLYRVGTNPLFVLAADVGADGDLDLLAANSGSASSTPATASWGPLASWRWE